MLRPRRQRPRTEAAIMKHKVTSAVDNGRAVEGSSKMSTLLSELDNVIKLKLVESPPTTAKPLNISLEPNTQTDWTRQRQYLEEIREFLDGYKQNLWHMGIIPGATAPGWVSAPLSVPKKRPTRFRPIVNFQAVNEGQGLLYGQYPRHRMN